MRNFLLALSFFFLLVCGKASGESFPVEFVKITDDVWIHRSYATVGGYKTPSNGLILETSKSAVLIDTAWNAEETEQIVRFIRETIRKPAAACFITHSHDDRSGGLKVISAAKISIYMPTMTFDLLKQPAYCKNYHPILNDRIKIDELDLQIDYFGPAHTEDNITVWEPRNRLLFGGCLVKALGPKNLGSVVDADISNWPTAIRRLREKYRDVKIVVPGHGEHGDGALLDFTLELLEG